MRFHFCINFLPLHSQLEEEFEFVELFSDFFLPQFLYILYILSHTGFEFLHFLKNPKIYVGEVLLQKNLNYNGEF